MNKELYISLIARQLSRELNTSQLENLNSWLSKSKDNANLLDEFKETWNATANYKQTLAIDVDSAFSSFASKFNIPSSDTPVEIPTAESKSKSRNLIIAILLLALLSLGYLLSTINSSTVSNNKMMATTTAINSNSDVTLSPNSQFTKGAAKEANSNLLNELTAIAALDTEDDKEYMPHALGFIPNKENYHIESFSGQAFFDFNNNTHKFIGLDNGNVIGASNAAFNVQNYTDDNTVVIDVQSGNVLFFDTKGNTFVINEGDRAIYDTRQKELIKAATPAINPFKWHKGILVFDNTPLDQAFKMLERFYGVDINITDNSVIDNKNFTATFPISSNLDSCLELIKASFEMDIERVDTRKVNISNIKGE